MSDKMTGTAVVEVTRVKEHAKYGKRYRVSKRVKAHNEKNEYRAGDRVVVEETRPLSREKRWRILRKVVVGGAAPEAEAGSMAGNEASVTGESETAQ